MSKIFEFDPVIYPTRVWVAVSPSYDDVNDKFYFLDESLDEVVEESKEKFDKHCSAIATTFAVVDRESAWKGVLVAIWRRKETGYGVVSHESTHCTDFLCDQLGIGGYSFNDGEPRAYYTQWVANCIGDVLHGRVK